MNIRFFIEKIFWTKWKENRLVEAEVAFIRSSAFQEIGRIDLAIKEISIGTSKMELIY